MVDFLKVLLSSVSAPLVDDRFSVLHEVVYQYRPGALLVIVPEVIIDGRSEVQQQVPGVFGDRSLVVLLEKCVPQVEELESGKMRVSYSRVGYDDEDLTCRP